MRQPARALRVHLATATACLLTGCTLAQDEAATPLDLVRLPATFTGVLPCADCAGIDYHLDLLPDGAFYLERTYLQREGQFDEIGAWSTVPGANRLTLWHATPGFTEFRIVDADTLRLLDRNGQDIESELNYNLTRAPAFDPASLTVSLRGMYAYLADAASFMECESGRRFAVAEEGDNAELQRAYLAARRQPDDSLLVSFEGRVTLRPPPEGTGLQPTVVVDTFTGVWPAETCGARESLSDLRGTNWVATRIGRDPVVIAAGEREARMVFATDSDGVRGFSGCNSFLGTATIRGSSLRFGQMATNLRACMGPASELEARLFAAIENAATFTLFRHHLDIYDGRGELVARFEARELD